MLVLYRDEQRWEDRRFVEFPSFLRAGDCLVLNNSKVIPSRLYGHRSRTRSLPIGKNNPKRWQHLSGRVEVRPALRIVRALPLSFNSPT